MKRFQANKWQVIKSYINWYKEELCDCIISAIGLLGIVGALLIGAMFFI